MRKLTSYLILIGLLSGSSHAMNESDLQANVIRPAFLFGLEEPCIGRDANHKEIWIGDPAQGVIFERHSSKVLNSDPVTDRLLKLKLAREAGNLDLLEEGDKHYLIVGDKRFDTSRIEAKFIAGAPESCVFRFDKATYMSYMDSELMSHVRFVLWANEKGFAKEMRLRLAATAPVVPTLTSTASDSHDAQFGRPIRGLELLDKLCADARDRNRAD